jgi:hypothetical protein
MVRGRSRNAQEADDFFPRDQSPPGFGRPSRGGRPSLRIDADTTIRLARLFALAVAMKRRPFTPSDDNLRLLSEHLQYEVMMTFGSALSLVESQGS